MGFMPAYRGGEGSVWSLKEIVIAPGNPARGLDAHQGAVLLHDGETGELRALLNASPITEIRTAAVSAVATRALARPDARVVAILGAGVQARSHAEAMRAVVRDAEIRTWSRGDGGTPEEVLREADIVCTCTSAREPILQREWLAAGTHVNAVGSSVPTVRELDTETMAASSLFVDRRESAVNESGDLLLAGLGEEHIRAELGEVLIGTHPGRAEQRRADRLQVARTRGRGPRRRRADRPEGPRARRSAPRSSSDPFRRDRARARDDRRRRDPNAAPPPAGRRAGGDLAQAREPAADRLVQDPRRRQRDPAGAARGDGQGRRHGERRQHGPGCRLGRPRARRAGDDHRSGQRTADEARCDRAARRHASSRCRTSGGGRSWSPRRLDEAEGLFVHPVQDERVMAGNGTIGIELAEELPDADAVLVPWGGGGLFTGIASALAALRPDAARLRRPARDGRGGDGRARGGRAARSRRVPALVRRRSRGEGGAARDVGASPPAARRRLHGDARRDRGRRPPARRASARDRGGRGCAGPGGGPLRAGPGAEARLHCLGRQHRRRPARDDPAAARRPTSSLGSCSAAGARTRRPRTAPPSIRSRRR